MGKLVLMHKEDMVKRYGAKLNFDTDNFDYDQLLKITNIDKSIFQNKLEWKVESDGFIISKN